MIYLLIAAFWIFIWAAQTRENAKTMPLRRAVLESAYPLFFLAACLALYALLDFAFDLSPKCHSDQQCADLRELSMEPH